MAEAMDFYDAPHSMGTTIMAVQYDGGVILGADSRTTTVRRGNWIVRVHMHWDQAIGLANAPDYLAKSVGVYVANRASDKITQLTDNVYICRSGSAADSQIVSDYARYFLNQHTIQLGQAATVKTAANIVRELSYGNKSFLECGLIVAGWDKYEKGSVYGIPLGGTILQLPFAIGGSGSSYLYGFLDQAWRDNMGKKDAEELVVKAVSLAMARDGSSGGVVRTVIIDAEGVTRHFYPGNELPLYYEEIPYCPPATTEPMAVSS